MSTHRVLEADWSLMRVVFYQITIANIGFVFEKDVRRMMAFVDEASVFSITSCKSTSLLSGMLHLLTQVTHAKMCHVNILVLSNMDVVPVVVICVCVFVLIPMP